MGSRQGRTFKMKEYLMIEVIPAAIAFVVASLSNVLAIVEAMQKVPCVTTLLHKRYEIEDRILKITPCDYLGSAMKTKPKPSYRVRNWSEYDAALKQRGSLTFWIDEVVIEGWVNEQRSGRRGASNHYSDGAIALMATVQSLFNLAGRQTEGFLESLFSLMGIDQPVPDHSTLSRRMRKVAVEMPVTPSEGTIYVVVDSTGVKVYGEGEWKVRPSWNR